VAVTAATSTAAGAAGVVWAAASEVAALPPQATEPIRERADAAATR
jgi:hypothetical protein